MELVNATSLRVGYTLGLDPDGAERIVVVVKGAVAIPPTGGVAPWSDAPEFVYADSFTGDPGRSATIQESEFAPSKPQCDVILHGSAYAPGGRPAACVEVKLRVGAMVKRFEVVGDRSWESRLGALRPGRPEPFVCMPLHFGRAFGSVTEGYAANPVGVGFHARADTAVVGMPLPNTQEAGNPVVSPQKNYRPMAFGALGRNFASRLAYAGTYDEGWLADSFPFLPHDFDTRYFQCAPEDQRIAHPRQEAAIELVNLTKRPIQPFALPSLEVPVEFTDAALRRTEKTADLDTIFLEPDLGRVQLTWRCSLPLRRNIHEVVQIVVGRMPPGWYRARKLGKTWYSSLAELTRAEQDEA